MLAIVPGPGYVDLFLGLGAARCLVVLLPGAGDRMGAFADNGFVAAIQASGASVDVLSADATMGYYFRGVVGDRLEQDLLASARAGHEHVWIVGVSMGGFGSLHYTQQHPEHVDGVIALAPYLGDRKLGEEIVRAGGLARWTPDPPAPLTKKNYQRQLWSWLHNPGSPGSAPIDADLSSALTIGLVQFVCQFSNNAALGYWNGLERQRLANARAAVFLLAKHALALLGVSLYWPSALAYLLPFAAIGAIVGLLPALRGMRLNIVDALAGR